MSNEDFSMRIKFYGTRGSIPVCSRAFQDFGGNTSCLTISIPDKNILSIIDAGTGIRTLGKELMENPDGLPREITLGFSHFHWDHIQGLPFFAPAYLSDYELNIIALGRGRNIKNLKDIFTRSMQEEYFPLGLDNMGATFTFEHIDSLRHTVRGIHAIALKHNHPGGAFTYRIQIDEKVFVVCTDIEHGDKINPEIVALANGADLLIHDGQYTEEELKTRKGWGHSSYQQAMQIAEQAGVNQLIITHHDPDHDDEFLRAREKECQARFPNCMLARDGMEIKI